MNLSEKQKEWAMYRLMYDAITVIAFILSLYIGYLIIWVDWTQMVLIPGPIFLFWIGHKIDIKTEKIKDKILADSETSTTDNIEPQ